jgi:hypothetical protein
MLESLNYECRNISGKLAKTPENLLNYFNEKRLDVMGFMEGNTLEEDVRHIREVFGSCDIYMDHDKHTRHRGVGFIIRPEFRKYVRSVEFHPTVRGRCGCLTLDFMCCSYRIVLWYLPAKGGNIGSVITRKIIEQSKIWLMLAKVEKSEVVLSGDMNCNIQDWVGNRSVRAVEIRKLCGDFGLHILHNRIPTWHRTVNGRKVQRVLDHIATSWHVLAPVIDTGYDGFIITDHKSIGLIVSLDVPTFNKIQYSMINTEDVKSFNGKFSQLPHDGSFKSIVTNLYDAAEQCLRVVGRSYHASKELRILNRQRKMLLAKRTKTKRYRPANSGAIFEIDKSLKIVKNSTRIEYQRLLKEKKKQSANVAHKYKVRWAYRALKPKPPAFRFYAFKPKPNVIVRHPNKVLKHARDVYKEMFKEPLSVSVPEKIKKLLRDTSTPWLDNGGVLDPVVMKRLKEEIQVLPLNSSGLDGISNQLLKSLDEEAVTLLALGISELLANSSPVPELLKQAFVSLVPKPITENDPMNIKNYRPITVLPCLYRLIMRIVNSRMMETVEKYCTISQSQRGFRRGASCTELAQIFQSVMNHARRNHNSLFAILLDYSNAYPFVRHQILFELLESLGIPVPIIHFVKHMYSGQHIQILTQYGLTEPVPFLNGVPQGDPFSPLAFNLYTEVLTRVFDHGNWSGYVDNGVAVKITSFADDTVLYAKSFRSLTSMIKKAQGIGEWMGLSINLKKSIAVKMDWCHRNNRKCLSVDPTNSEKLFIDGFPVLYSGDSFRYLGFILNARNSVGNSSNMVKNSVYKATNSAFVANIHSVIFKNCILSIIYGKVRYYSGLGSLSGSICEKIDARFHNLYRYNMGAHFRHHSIWYHLPIKQGGLNVPSTWEILHKTRVSNLLQCLNSSFNTCALLTLANLKESVYYFDPSHDSRDPMMITLAMLNKNNVFLANYKYQYKLYQINPVIPENSESFVFKKLELESIGDCSKDVIV